MENSFRMAGFLIDRKYRIWRYVFFVLVGFIITSSMVFVAYMDCHAQLGNRIYLLSFLSCLCYSLAMLFNYHYLVPRFLLKGRYAAYTVILLITAFLLPALSVVEEYGARTVWNLPHRITSYTSPLIWIDNLSSSILLLMCFLGVSAILLFRQWKSQEEQLDRMEYAHYLAEVNKLKGQITPSFLSHTLLHAAATLHANSRNASVLLMQLSRLLRYQLYDCNRERVLLVSEIDQLDRFLSIHQLSKEGFEYEIRTAPGLANCFIPPLLFISLVQCVVAECSRVKLYFSSDCEGKRLSFRCESDRENGLSLPEIASCRKRLDLHYPASYTLTFEAERIELKIARS